MNEFLGLDVHSGNNKIHGNLLRNKPCKGDVDGLWVNDRHSLLYIQDTPERIVVPHPGAERH